MRLTEVTQDVNLQLMQSIKLRAGSSSSGELVFEEVLVANVEQARFRVLRTPGLVLGIARDDEISYDARTNTFSLERRGRRGAVQLYTDKAHQRDFERLAAQLELAVSATWDGLSEKQAIFSFPAATGFAGAEELLNRFVQTHAGAEWYYGNIYAEDGASPLNWWLDA